MEIKSDLPVPDKGHVRVGDYFIEDFPFRGAPVMYQVTRTEDTFFEYKGGGICAGGPYETSNGIFFRENERGILEAIAVSKNINTKEKEEPHPFGHLTSTNPEGER